MDEKNKTDMISIIICSMNPDISAELRQNIADTIGCEYELVVIDNSRNQLSIFQAYNRGVQRSKGDILCFMHDDLLMHTNGWGTIVSEEFEDDSIGMIGVAGSHIMPKAPMYWWSSPYIAQYNWETDNGVTKENITVDTFYGDLADVAVVDGLFFCIPKSLFANLRFDDAGYTGFHAYDMDMSMQIQALGKRVCVTRKIIVEHFWSESQFQNKKYMALLDKNMEAFFDKWKDSLPIARGLNEPNVVFQRINNLCVAAYDAKKVRQSKAYKLGRLLLSPLRFFK